MSYLRLLQLLCCSMLFAVLTASCEHRPLEDPVNTHYVRIYVDEDIRNVTFGFYNDTYERPTYTRPRVLRLVLADRKTGKVVKETYLQRQGEDEKGYYIDGYVSAAPGTYNLQAYSFGSAYTKVRNENDFFSMLAYTDPVSDYYKKYLPSLSRSLDMNSVVQQPEHFFHMVEENYNIARSSSPDTLRSSNGEYFRAHSMVLSYYIQLKVKGIEWAKSAVSVLGGMAGSSLIHKHRGMVETNPVNVLFTLKQTNRQRRSTDDATTAVLYTTFQTFGKLPDLPSVLAVSIEFVKRDGSSQVEEIDITKMFDTPMVRDKQWILIEPEIELTPPEGTIVGGGLTPGVDEWEDIESGILL
ncbi:MAG: DUF5119 domain-containing protein [Bacteroidaceae bacterium]|nr:DUF5119 domain-containing protein [Bacteroidaceae bacterium]